MIDLLLPESLTRRSETDDFWYGPAGVATSSAVKVDGDVALTYSAVWAATRILSSTIAALPLQLYRKRAGGGRDVLASDLRNTLVHSRPNRDMGAMMWRSTALAQQINAGNSHAEVQRVDGRPVALWPIHESRVEVKRDDQTNQLFYEVKNNGGKPPSVIMAEDMLHVPSSMSRDGVCGLGVIQQARESIGFGLATERHGASAFGSRGIPRVVLKHPGKPSPEARQNMRSEWRELYGRPDSETVAVLAEGMDLVPLGLSAEDMQFLATRQHNVEEIARWYGVPPHLIQHLLRSTFNNIEHSGIEFVVYTLNPLLTLWEQELGNKLLTDAERKSGYYFKHNVNALLRGDMAARSAFYQSLFNMGALSPNDILDLEDRNPFEGGDTHLVHSAMVPIQKAGNSIPDEPIEPDSDEPDPAPVPEPAPEPEGNDDNGDGLSAVLEAIERNGEALALNSETFAAALRRECLNIVSETLAKWQPPEPEPVSTEPDERLGKLQEAAEAMLTAGLRRIVKMHATAARRASKKTGDFLGWNDGFGDSIRQSMLAELESPAAAFAALGMPLDCEQIVSHHLSQAHGELLEASGAEREQFESSVEACVSTWEAGRVSALLEFARNNLQGA